MFILRRLLAPIVFLIALFLGGSALLENFAESQLSSGMRTTLNIRSRPAVQIEAFPIILRIVQGRIPRVRVDARNVVLEGLQIDELLVDMRGVEASVDVLIRQNKFDLTVEDGTATATISEDSINAFLKREKRNVHVTLKPDGTVVVRADRIVAGRSRRFESTGRVTLDGRNLVFKPTRTTMDGVPVPSSLAAFGRRESSFSVEIPTLPAGIVPTEVIVTFGRLRLAATLEGYVLKVR